MEKLKMHTQDVAEANIEKIGQLFPNCLTERMNENGKPEMAIDFDKLKQELSKEIVEGNQERYQFTWPGKREAMRLANTPSNMTLRPDRESSVDFDNTENLYIEGDNLEVLKLLREDYLGKIKVIYIDPPYNTGNDFVYEDDFSETTGEFKDKSGMFDDSGNMILSRFEQNTESNGRFHTDWLNMIYPRLKVAKDLLMEDGVIFISIDDNEIENLRKVCDEVFGERNFVAQFVWVKKKKGSHLSKTTRSMTEYVLSYSKNIENLELFGERAYADKQQPLAKRTNTHKDLLFPANVVHTTLKDGEYNEGLYGEGSSSVYFKSFTVKDGIVITELRANGPFTWTQPKLDQELAAGTTANLSSKFGFNVLRSDQADKIKRPSTLIDSSCGVGTNEDAYNEGISLFGQEGIMSYPKPVSLMSYLINSVTHFDKDGLILDFFSGSASTAHSIMQLNQQDGGNRRYILVQIPEIVDKDSAAYKAGYKTICDIAKARIVKAAAQLNSGNKDEDLFTEKPSNDYDFGFRTLKLSTSNMQDVYYKPEEFSETSLFEDNVKPDRTPEDLLFQVMLECNLPLSAKIERKTIAGKEVFNVNDGYLLACFDEDVNETVITEVAKLKPYYFIMRDKSLSSDNVADNFEQIFNAYSKDTIRKIL